MLSYNRVNFRKKVFIDALQALAQDPNGLNNYMLFFCVCTQ